MRLLADGSMFEQIVVLHSLFRLSSVAAC